MVPNASMRGERMDSPARDGNDPETKRLEYQLDFLRLEYQVINQAIGRFDDVTQATKNWAVVIWAGGLALLLGAAEMRRYILVTAVLPLVFWFIDAQWRRIQRSFVFRLELISRFLNGDDLLESLRPKKVINLRLVDHRARAERHTDEYLEFTTMKRTWRFKEVGVFYLGLSLVSIMVALVLACV
ncbi:MAG: hypothetical protein AB7O37_07960 [Vicinamibacteria bacterium]